MNIRVKLEEVWGNYIGQCAWCLNHEATHEYEGQQAGGDIVLYRVCKVCYNNAPNATQFY